MGSFIARTVSAADHARIMTGQTPSGHLSSDKAGKIAVPGPLMVLLGGICIGFSPIGFRYGLDDLGPQAIAFWRYVFALPVLYGLLIITGHPRPQKPNRFVVLAALLFTMDIAIWHWALDITSVANATFLINLGNIMVGFFAWIFLKDKPAPIWFIAVIFAVSGVAALSLGGGDNGFSVLTGDVLALIGALFVAGYMICSKIARGSLGAIETIFWLTFFEIIFEGFIVIASGETLLPADMSGFAAPLFLALIVQVCGQGLIITGLGQTPAAIAGVMVVVQPVIAAILAWQLFNEPLLPLQFIGAGLILFALLLAQRAVSPSAALKAPNKSS